jgi:SPP1 gp7 family putative phage head morphogenesis protein
MAIDQQFQEFNQKRAETIARTEITRASNEAYIEAYEQNGINKKQWFTAMDERVCPECNELHGTIKEVREDFFETTFGNGQ